MFSVVRITDSEYVCPPRDGSESSRIEGPALHILIPVRITCQRAGAFPLVREPTSVNGLPTSVKAASTPIFSCGFEFRRRTRCVRGGRMYQTDRGGQGADRTPTSSAIALPGLGYQPMLGPKLLTTLTGDSDRQFRADLRRDRRAAGAAPPPRRVTLQRSASAPASSANLGMRAAKAVASGRSKR